MFVRVWEYAVPANNLEAFLAAYGANGAWVELFRRSTGYAGTELYRSTDVADRFITVDRWANEADWESFLAEWGEAYETLDARLEGLAAVERAVLEGSS